MQPSMLMETGSMIMTMAENDMKHCVYQQARGHDSMSKPQLHDSICLR